MVRESSLGESGRALSEGQGEHSLRVRESSLRGSGRVLSEGQGEFSQRVMESALKESGRVLSKRVQGNIVPIVTNSLNIKLSLVQ